MVCASPGTSDYCLTEGKCLSAEIHKGRLRGIAAFSVAHFVEGREVNCRLKSTKCDSAESPHFWSSALSKRDKSAVGRSRHFVLLRKRWCHRSDFSPWSVLSSRSSLCIKRNGSGFQLLSRILDLSRFSGNPPEGIVALGSRRLRCRK